MEVTTVSPSAISPTEGDDLCEIDVTNVAIHSVTLLIGLCGLAGNGAVLCLVSLKSDLTIFVLAATDFLFLLFAVPSSLVFLLEGLSCTPIMPLMYLSFLFQLSVVSYYWVLFRLIRLNFVFDTSMFCLLCCPCDLSLRLSVFVGSVQHWALIILITVLPVVTSLCPSHEQELCRVSFISMYAIILLLVAVPTVIYRTIKFIKAKRGSPQQRNRHNIILALIVLFTLVLSLWNIMQELHFIIVPSHIVFLLACINSSIKPFIYFLAGISWSHCSVGSCWRHCTVGSLRDSLKRVFEQSEENTPNTNDAAMDTVI